MSDDRAKPRTLTAVFARLRVPLGFASAVVVFWLAKPTGVLILAGTLIMLPGELLRIWAAGHLVKSSEVTSSGPYRWFAHPLYVGSSTMGAGLAVASGSVAAAILIAVYLTITIGAAIRSEEAFLRRRFGDHYERYRGAGVVHDKLRMKVKKVRMKVREERRFSLARAIGNREHRAVIGLAAGLLLLALKATYNGVFWRTAGGRFVGPGG